MLRVGDGGRLQPLGTNNLGTDLLSGGARQRFVEG